MHRLAIVLLITLATACRTTSGKVLGTVFGASAIAGNGLVCTSERDTPRMAAGFGLILLSTMTLLGWIYVESPATSGGHGLDSITTAGTTSTSVSDGGHVEANGDYVDHTGAKVGRVDSQGNFYDRTGALSGRFDAQGTYYDRTGAVDGRIDASGTYYDRTGALAGRMDPQGQYYDRTGAVAGRVDPQGQYYDRTGAVAGRIDAQGTIYDKTGAVAGRIDGSCDDACKRATTGRILLGE